MKIENITSLRITNGLNKTYRALARSMERLASGKRVASPRDDVASFSQSVKLEAQIRGIVQSNLNISQAQSVVQTASAAIQTQIDIVQKMRELALQAANTNLSASERDSINTQLNTLMTQFDQISSSTQLNGIHLLDGSTSDLQFLIGPNPGDELTIDLPKIQSGDIFSKQVQNGFVGTTQTSSDGGDGFQGESELIDLNGDGNLDYIKALNSRALQVFYGNGEGIFSAGQCISTTSYSFTAGDVDGDGDADLIVRSSTSGGEVEIQLNDGEGNFSIAQTFSAYDGVSNGSVLLSDIDNDGDLDVIVQGSASNSIQTLINDGYGRYTQSATSAITAVRLNNSSAGDFNNDGYADIVTGNTVLEVLLGDGLGNFTQSATLSGSSFSGFANPTEVGDFDGDGNLDFVLVDGLGSRFLFFFGDGTGQFSNDQTISIASSYYSALLDFDSDGDLDFIATTGGNRISFYENDGTGAFSLSRTVGVTSNFNIVVGDIDNDGISDLVADGQSQLYSLLGKARPESAKADFKIESEDGAAELLGVIDGALGSLQENLAGLSAAQSRLDFAASYNLLQSQSLEDAKSRIQDVDLTLEIADLVQNQILAQAQVAALSQSNLNLQLVLQLFDSLN